MGCSFMCVCVTSTNVRYSTYHDPNSFGIYFQRLFLLLRPGGMSISGWAITFPAPALANKSSEFTRALMKRYRHSSLFNSVVHCCLITLPMHRLLHTTSCNSILFLRRRRRIPLNELYFPRSLGFFHVPLTINSST